MFDEDKEYVTPDSPEAQRFCDGAKVVICRFCSAWLLLPMYSKDRDCGEHEPWRVWFTDN